jgi:hypothetical protein
MMVGALHKGRKVVMGAIDFERAALSSPGMVEMQGNHLLDWCATARAGGEPPVEDPPCAG